MNKRSKDEFSAENDTGYSAYLKYSNRKNWRPLLSIPLLLLVILIAFGIRHFQVSDQGYYLKRPILDQLSKAIRNNADIETLKFIYDSRPIITPEFEIPKNDQGETYDADYPLSDLLRELIKENYTSTNIDTAFISKLKRVSTDYNETDPFDKLPINQRDIFTNIRTKLGGSYETIQPEILKLSDELDSKNQLVEKYLNRSDSSYFISIVALIVSLFGLFQLFISSPGYIKKVLNSIFSEKTKPNQN